MEVLKKDWKLYREKIPEWQEVYMEKLIASYVKYLEGEEQIYNTSNSFYYDKVITHQTGA